MIKCKHYMCIFAEKGKLPIGFTYADDSLCPRHFGKMAGHLVLKTPEFLHGTFVHEKFTSGLKR